MPAVRKYIAEILASIAGVPVVGQFGWNSTSRLPAVCSTVGVWRDLGARFDIIQTAVGGSTNVADDTDTVIVANAAVAAIVRLPLPATAYLGRRITVVRDRSTASTGALTVTTVSGTLKLVQTNGATVTSITLTTAQRAATFIGTATHWIRLT